MAWERPVPVIGDVSTAAQRAADPAGWAFPPEQVEALHAVIAARRDVRRFRPDEVPIEVVKRLLAAAHAAPSVGHSQPWRFLVVRDARLREEAALLADRERLRQAAELEPDAARRLLDLKLEGIREAPLGIVVCCDRRVPAKGVLGRATFPDADMWSCACAIQNLWLAARASGLGMGWVTLFRPADLADLLGLPPGVETLGWLCLGWPDERPPTPGLERAGWSRKLPLDQVWNHDRWPSDSPTPVSHLRAPSQAAVVAATDEADLLLTPPGSLGVLDRAVDRLLALNVPDRATLVLAAADHPVAALGVSAYEPTVTRSVFEAALAGSSLGVASAHASGMHTLLIDAGVDAPSNAAVRISAIDPRGDLASTDAMSIADTHRFVEFGKAHAPEGIVALGEIGIGNTTVAACLAASLLNLSPADAVGLGAGADAAILERKRAVVASALARTSPDSPIRTLAAFGGPEIAVLTGIILSGRAAIVLDGLATSVAALIAVRLEPGVASRLIAGQRSRERAHALVLTELGLEPLLDLRIRAGEGAGACLATGLLRQALTMRRTTARTQG